MIDWEAIFNHIAQRVEEGVDKAADRVAAVAVKNAPVRKVFAGGHQVRRFKTRAEVEADISQMGARPGDMIAAPPGMKYSRAAFRRTGYAAIVTGGYGGRGNTANDFKPRIAMPPSGHRTYGDWRQIEQQGGSWQMKSPEAAAQLTSRGAYELKSGRAVSTEFPGTKGKSATLEQVEKAETHRLGGTLRGTIENKGVEIDGPLIQAYVVAGGEDAPYAKYVEWGSRHAAAQPFMRPAWKEAQAILPAEIKRALARW